MKVYITVNTPETDKDKVQAALRKAMQALKESLRAQGVSVEEQWADY